MSTYDIKSIIAISSIVRIELLIIRIIALLKLRSIGGYINNNFFWIEIISGFFFSRNLIYRQTNRLIFILIKV